jgi:hypothetical protein
VRSDQRGKKKPCFFSFLRWDGRLRMRVSCLDSNSPRRIADSKVAEIWMRSTTLSGQMIGFTRVSTRKVLWFCLSRACIVVGI